MRVAWEDEYRFVFIDWRGLKCVGAFGVFNGKRTDNRSPKLRRSMSPFVTKCQWKTLGTYLLAETSVPYEKETVPSF